jgi:hypothetical protein
MVRVDLVHRDFRDFYSTRLDLTTGDVTTPNGTFNLRLYENENDLLERTYDALQTSFSYRLAKSISLGGNYTLSRLRGNFVGENAASGPLTSSVSEYPEYKQMSWWSPKGELGCGSSTTYCPPSVRCSRSRSCRTSSPAPRTARWARSRCATPPTSTT